MVEFLHEPTYFAIFLRFLYQVEINWSKEFRQKAYPNRHETQ